MTEKKSDKSRGINMTGMQAPCEGCKRRTIGCHAKCDAYKAFRAEREETYAKREEEMRRNDLIYGGKKR